MQTKVFDLIYEHGIDRLVEYAKTGIALDTKPLILYLVGIYDSENETNYLQQFGYSRKDFDRLNRFISALNSKPTIYVTPQILTEVFYFIRKKRSINFVEFTNKMSRVFVNVVNEVYKHKDNIVTHEKFTSFGFSDVSIMLCLTLEDIRTMITDEINLSQYCLSLRDKQRLIINFRQDIIPYFQTIQNN